MSLYTDRGAHYFHTPKAGGEIDRGHPTQAGRALEQFGVEPIGAYSPQARGRSERTFGTLQGRLPKELALARSQRSKRPTPLFARSIRCPPTTPVSRLSRPPKIRPSRSVPGVDLDEILGVEEERQVGNDNCVPYRTLKLQIPESPMRPHFVKARVKVHVYPDDLHALFHGPRCIGRYDDNGTIQRCQKCRLNPLGDATLWTTWTSLRLADPAHRQNQNRRSGHSVC